jgi:hypothetical protein
MKASQEAVVKSIREERLNYLAPETREEYMIMRLKGFNYHAVDLRSVDFNEIVDIVSGCEAVENDTWKAQEDFFQYIRKSDLLVYAEKDGRIVGFNLVSFILINEYCFYTIDEAMVLRAFQGNNIARNVVTTALWWFLKKIELDGQVRKMVLVSISANPKVVNNYFKNRYITRLLDNSFFPSEDLVRAHHGYLHKYNFTLVDNRYPFCISNLFPGSQQLDWTDKRYQFLDDVRKRMPSEFDHAVRGDAWAFMAVANLRLAFIIIRLLPFLFFGTEALFNRKIGLLKRRKQTAAIPHLTRIRLIDERFSERRIYDRRSGDRRTSDLGCDANGVNRRTSNRRYNERRSLSR